MNINRKQFEKLADRIVEENFGNDLNDPLAKVAIHENMSPEAIKTLIHMVNTLASLKHLETSEDKSDDFALAEPSKVLRIVFKVAPKDEEALEDEGHDDSGSCPGLDHYSTSPGSDVKEAAYLEDEALNEARKAAETATLPTYQRDVGAERSFFRKRGLQEYFLAQRAQASQEYKDVISKLATDFSGLHGPNVSEFEKNALAVCGDIAIPHLMNIRHSMRKDAPDYDALTENEKIASANRLVNMETPSMGKLAHLLELERVYNTLSETIEKLSSDELVAK